MSKKVKLILAAVVALLTALSAGYDKVAPALESLVAALGEEPNPEVIRLPTAGSLSDEDGGV
jgi:hypothetical protein